jgi:hypothetical protein
MAGPGTIAINGTVSGLLTGSKVIGPLTISVSLAKAWTEVYSITPSANTTIDIPSGVSAAVMVFDTANNDQVISIKGVAGDTGVPVKSKLPNVICVSGTTSLVIGNTTTFTISLQAVFI